VLKNVAAFLFFFGVMGWILLILGIMPLMMLSEIQKIRTIGFATMSIAPAAVGVCGLFVGLSMLVPAFRKIYQFLPWLSAYVKMFFLNLIITAVGFEIVNYGYEVQNSSRHTLFFILAILLMVVCRIAMGLYYYLRPAKPVGGDHDE
jgi:Ca2+/H+ antiporter